MNIRKLIRVGRISSEKKNDAGVVPVVLGATLRVRNSTCIFVSTCQIVYMIWYTKYDPCYKYTDPQRVVNKRRRV